MHRELLGLTKREEQGDHIDGDTLNNQRNNIRKCTAKQNSWNRRPKDNGTSKYIGVYRNKSTNKYKSKKTGIVKTYVAFRWAARIRDGVKDYFLGCFLNEEDAARAYDRKAKELHPEFAKLNFP